MKTALLDPVKVKRGPGMGWKLRQQPLIQSRSTQNEYEKPGRVHGWSPEIKTDSLARGSDHADPEFRMSA